MKFNQRRDHENWGVMLPSKWATGNYSPVTDLKGTYKKHLSQVVLCKKKKDNQHTLYSHFLKASLLKRGISNLKHWNLATHCYSSSIFLVHCTTRKGSTNSYQVMLSQLQGKPCALIKYLHQYNIISFVLNPLLFVPKSKLNLLILKLVTEKVKALHI